MKFTQGIIVDGTYFDLPMVSLKRSADFLDKLHRELIGVYYNFTLTVGASTAFGETTDYDAFWDKMTEPAEFHDFELPSGNGTYRFTGYISSVSDEYSKILAGDSQFKGFTCKMTAQAPARS